MTKPGYITHATLFIRINAADPKPRELAWQEFRDRYAPVIVGSIGLVQRNGLKPRGLADAMQTFK